MRRLIKLSTPILVAMFFLGGSALAGKRLDVMVMSNGYPSGPHYNLNIHGKDTATFSCDITNPGSSVFISEYGTSTIEYVSNKRAFLTELTVLDACAEAFDGNPVRVQLPYETEGYYVFARLRGKPQNSQNPGDSSSIILTPNPVLKVCNDPGNPDFPDYTECDGSLWTLGLVTTEGVYKTTQAGFYRFDGNNESKGKGKGKGNGKATDITGLFQWTGYVCNVSLDTSGPDGVPDGVIDEYDVPGTYDTDGTPGISQVELNAWLADQEASGFCTFHKEAYIWDIADLVVQGQEVVNDGAKLLKIRWYPVKTTDFN